jgi:hypothetical protein
MNNDDLTHREERIRQRARELWLAAGTPNGRDEDFWHQASAEIDTADANRGPQRPRGES